MRARSALRDSARKMSVRRSSSSSVTENRTGSLWWLDHEQVVTTCVMRIGLTRVTARCATSLTSPPQRLSLAVARFEPSTRFGKVLHDGRVRGRANACRRDSALVRSVTYLGRDRIAVLAGHASDRPAARATATVQAGRSALLGASRRRSRTSVPATSRTWRAPSRSSPLPRTRQPARQQVPSS